MVYNRRLTQSFGASRIMKDHTQQTDSTNDLISNQSYIFEFIDETIGSSSLEWFTSVAEFHLMGQAVSVALQIKNKSVREQAIQLLSTIRGIMSFLLHIKTDLSRMPPLKICNYDDDSISIEWAFPDFRIGFNIEIDPAESGWHLVSNERLSHIMSSGSLETPLGTLVYQLINTILAYI